MGNSPTALCSKTLYRYGNSFYRIGTCSMQGFRTSQEDAHRVVLEIPNHANQSFFGVFDGHGGGEASKFVRKKLIHSISALERFDDESLRQMMIELDQAFLSECNEYREHGTTCVFALVKQRFDEKENIDMYDIICSNLGDSRCLLLRNSEDEEVLKSNQSAEDAKKSSTSMEALSEDHKPDLEVESKRISKAGGLIIANRVDGNLAVSRGIGDQQLKSNHKLRPEEQKVSCVPDIRRTTCKSGDFLFLSCDGIFEMLDNTQVVDFIRSNYDSEIKDPAKTLSILFDRALDSGSTDNMTSILIHLNPGIDFQHGLQYIPGPFYSNRSDLSFQASFFREALDYNYDDQSPLLRILAYYRDLLNCEHRSYLWKEICFALYELHPEDLSIEQQVQLVNATEQQIIIESRYIDFLTETFKNAGQIFESLLLLEEKEETSLKIQTKCMRLSEPVIRVLTKQARLWSDQRKSAEEQADEYKNERINNQEDNGCKEETANTSSSKVIKKVSDESKSNNKQEEDKEQGQYWSSSSSESSSPSSLSESEADEDMEMDLERLDQHQDSNKMDIDDDKDNKIETISSESTSLDSNKGSLNTEPKNSENNSFSSKINSDNLSPINSETNTSTNQSFSTRNHSPTIPSKERSPEQDKTQPSHQQALPSIV